MEVDLLFNPPTEQEFETIPGFRAAYAHKEEAKNEWVAFKNELSKRMSAMDFTDLLNQWRATCEQDENSAIARAYTDGVNERLKFVFSNSSFEEWFDLENWADLSILDLPFMLANAQELLEWHRQPENEELYCSFMPWPGQEERIIAQLTAAIQHVRAYHGPRTMAFLMGTHPRAPAGIRKLDPLILREITRSARAPSERFPPYLDPRWES